MGKGAWWACACEVTLCFLFQLKTTTTAVISKDFTEDQIWLNGQKVDIEHPRIQACLRESKWGSHVGCWGQVQSVPSLPSSGQGLRAQPVLLALCFSPSFLSPWDRGVAY